MHDPQTRVETPPVVVATDLSASSAKALTVADRWCKHHGAALVVCHVVPDLTGAIAPLMPHARSTVPDRDELEGARRAVVDQVFACTARAEGSYALVVERGVAENVVRAVAEAVAPLMVVVGCGESTLAATVLGSTAEALATSCPAPVLLVRSDDLDGPIIATLEARGELSRTRHAGVRLADACSTSLAFVRDVDPVEFADRRDASLIVIDGESRHDDSTDVIRRAHCSVLVVRGDGPLVAPLSEQRPQPPAH